MMAEANQLEHSGVVVWTHTADNCRADACPIHHRSAHQMRAWPQHWRGDRHIIERICPHGVGHPDADDPSADRVHGCDGCCQPGGLMTAATIAAGQGASPSLARQLVVPSETLTCLRCSADVALVEQLADTLTEDVRRWQCLDADCAATGLLTLTMSVTQHRQLAAPRHVIAPRSWRMS